MATPAGASLQTVSEILQRMYVPGLIRQFNDSYPNLTYIRQNSEDITAEGSSAIVAIEVGLNESGGVHGESADVPQASSPKARNVTVALKQMTFRARITWRLMKKAKTTAHAFARSLDLTMRSTRDAFILTANQYTWGDGSGVVARVATSSSTSGYIQIDRAHGITGGGQPFGLIRTNQVLHITNGKAYTAGSTTDRGTFKVTGVDVETGAAATVPYVLAYCTQLSGTAWLTGSTPTADDYVYLQNSIAGWTDSDETEDNTPPMGMLGFYDDSLVDPLQGLAVATEPQWKPHKQTIAQATVISDFNKARDALMKRNPRGRIRYLISSYETRQRWHDQLVEKAEWRNVNTLDGSFDVAVYAGRPWFADHTAPDGIAFFVPEGDYLQRYSASEFIEVIDDDNSTLHLVPDKTVYDVLFSALYEYGTKRRNVLVSATSMTW
jgi:hypothetical protein